MTNALGVAVIGAGMAGRAHAHGYRSAGTVFSAGLPPVRLVSVADINEDLARDTARRYGFERHDTSWEAIVKAEDINVVSVVVANHLHREMSLSSPPRASTSSARSRWPPARPTPAP
jgi:predicted dehydrogenase